MTLTERLIASGYALHGATPAHVREIGDGWYALAYRLLFHWTVIYGHESDIPAQYSDRWCFATEDLALAAIRDWPADAHPPQYEPVGWHRHPNTGRRRPAGNPALEYTES